MAKARGFPEELMTAEDRLLEAKGREQLKTYRARLPLDFDEADDMTHLRTAAIIRRASALLLRTADRAGGTGLRRRR